MFTHDVVGRWVLKTGKIKHSGNPAFAICHHVRHAAFAPFLLSFAPSSACWSDDAIAAHGSVRSDYITISALATFAARQMEFPASRTAMTNMEGNSQCVLHDPLRQQSAISGGESSASEIGPFRSEPLASPATRRRRLASVHPSRGPRLRAVPRSALCNL
jgi:hypothetical protein